MTKRVDGREENIRDLGRGDYFGEQVIIFQLRLFVCGTDDYFGEVVYPLGNRRLSIILGNR